MISALASDLRTALDEIGAKVTCSIGVITCPDARISADQAVAAADALMYEVKRKRKNSVDFSVVGEAQTATSPHELRPAHR